MRLSAIGFLMIVTTFFLSGCAQDPHATVVSHASDYYGRLAQTLPRVAPSLSAAPPLAANVTPAPVIENVLHTEPHLAAAQPATWQWPVEGNIIRHFGHEKNGLASEGITIAAPEGTPIHAAQKGQVAFVGQNIRDYGNIVILRHPDRTLTSYAHAREITVKKGDQIAAGGLVGFVGHTGSVKTPQLHFALREGDRAVDPLGKLPQNLASN